MSATRGARRSHRPRVTKDPDVRRDELLDIAWELCRDDGFEAMSIDQLTRTAGVAKGTFYLYFASRDALLEALAQRVGEAPFRQLAAAAAAATGTASQRLRLIMNAACTYKVTSADLTDAALLYQPGNLALRHRAFAAWRGHTRRLLLPVVRDGQSDGSLRVTDAEVTTDLLVLLWFEAADQLWKRALDAPDADALGDLILAGDMTLSQAQERMLGVPEGTYAVPEGPELVRRACQLARLLSDGSV